MIRIDSSYLKHATVRHPKPHQEVIVLATPPSGKMVSGGLMMMEEFQIGLRQLWVTAAGTVRRVNQNGTRLVQEWARTSILSVEVIGVRRGSEFLHFNRFHFSVRHINQQGRAIYDVIDQRQQLALIPPLLDAEAHGSIVPRVIPNPEQQTAISAYLAIHWPAAMAHPISKLAWAEALHPTRNRVADSTVRLAVRVFQAPPSDH